MVMAPACRVSSSIPQTGFPTGFLQHYEQAKDEVAVDLQ
jgi:hypothetical protein